MIKDIHTKNTLAACIRGKKNLSSNNNILIRDFLYDISNHRSLQFQHRKKYALTLFTIAVVLTISRTPQSELLNIATLSERFDIGGFLFATLPLLFLLYVFEGLIRRFHATKDKLGPLYGAIFIAPVCILITLDLNFITAPYNVINTSCFALVTALLWPARKRRSYYTKKHIDKRTK